MRPTSSQTLPWKGRHQCFQRFDYGTDKFASSRCNRPSAHHRHDFATVSQNPPSDATTGSHTALPNMQITATLSWPSFSSQTCTSETYPSSSTFGTVNQGTRRRTRTRDPPMMKSRKARQRDPLLTPRALRAHETRRSIGHPPRYLCKTK